jgi:HNH endonuclease/AP2 domain
MSKPNLTAERLRELLHYEPSTGVFTRRVKTGGRYGADVGSVAGTLNDSGYLLISVQSKQYRAHRLAVLYITGGWPAQEVDHRNGDRLDNRWSNLREVSTQVNSQNRRRAQSNSKTGLLGASWCARDKRFTARIKVGDKYQSLGRFDTAEKAHAAYVNAKRRLHSGCTI